MKRILLLIVLFIGVFANAQKLDKIDSLDMNNYPDLSNYKNKSEVNVLKLKDGSFLRAGDKLILGDVSDSNNTTVFNGKKSTDYTYVFVGKFNLMNAMGGVAFNASEKSQKLVIEEIFLYKSGKAKQILVQFKKENTNLTGHIRDIEIAISNGEIINPNRAMTREEAIKKLKESKDLLDLEMISKDEYDKIKSELEPIIKGN